MSDHAPVKVLGGAQAQSEATSETPKFTPGPWSMKLAPNGDCGICAEGTGIFAEAFSDIRIQGEGDRIEALANACLMKASPDLYEALRDFVSAQSALADYSGKYEGETWHVLLRRLHACEEPALAALRKAEGGK